MPPVTARTNLATVTYPVTLATQAQQGYSADTNEILWNVESPKNCIDQFSILLTRKDQPLRAGSRHLPVFSRVNRMKATQGTTRTQKRLYLQNALKFAGIAFTGVEDGNGDGSPNMIASVIGGSHTVMSFRSDHKPEPLRPGTTVRWTLPEVNDTVPPPLQPPVTYYGSSGKGVFAELEEVTPESTLKCIKELIFISTDPAIEKLKKDLHCSCLPGATCSCFDAAVKSLLRIIGNVQEREIGVVIQDNNKGSVDIRLK